MTPDRETSRREEIGVAILVLSSRIGSRTARHGSGRYEVLLDAAVVLLVVAFAWAHLG